MRTASALLAALCLSTTGCLASVHSHDIRNADDVHSQWNSFFFFGNAGTAEVDVREVCGPDRAAAWMGVGENFGTVLVTILTLEIYSPKMSYVSCGTPRVPPAETPPPVAPSAPAAPPAAPPPSPAQPSPSPSPVSL